MIRTSMSLRTVSVDTTRRNVLRLGAGLGVGVGVVALSGCSSDTPKASAEPTSLPEVEGARRLTYGKAPSQWVDVALPSPGPTDETTDTDLAPALVVLVHGGFWLDQYGADLMTPLARDLIKRGYAVANLEYRRLGEDGGGWPGTFEDVAAGIDRLATMGDDLGRAAPTKVITVGHSAGGQLGVWAAGRHRLDADAVGGDPAVKPIAAVSLAGVLDLRGAANQGVGGGVVTELLGGDPQEKPDRYAVASPLSLLPLGLPTLCVHGTADGNVPISQSETYVDSALPLGDDVTLEAIDGADHFVVIDPTAEPWRQTVEWIDGALT